MSRTLVHRPWSEWFDSASHCLEEHRHEDGPCDLPSLEVWRQHLRDFTFAPRPWRCGWALDLTQLPNFCGCELCTGSFGRRLDRRADRQRAKLLLRTGKWRQEYDDVSGASGAPR